MELKTLKMLTYIILTSELTFQFLLNLNNFFFKCFQFCYQFLVIALYNRATILQNIMKSVSEKNTILSHYESKHS